MNVKKFRKGLMVFSVYFFILLAVLSNNFTDCLLAGCFYVLFLKLTDLERRFDNRV